MSNLGKKVLLYRTDISGKTPNISDVAIGELALNYNANSPFLAFKDTNNELQKIGALSNNTGDSEFVTMSQKAITEALENYYTKSETYNKEEVNELVNNLDIDHKLSETYESVIYPSVEDTDGIEFIAAKANDDLDTVVSNLDRNVSTLVQEVLNNEEVTAAAITEIKESVGLDENLKYVVNTETTYINNATSFAEADNLLDAAISNIINEIPSLDDYATKEYVTSQLGNVDLSEINEQLEEANTKISLIETQLSAATSTISTLESKLDAIIRAVGLNSDGTFIVPTTAQTSGYTTAATSVMSAIHLMDNQIEENETVTAYSLTDLNDRLKELDSKITDFENETNIS